MSHPDIGFGKSSWYWLVFTAWGICCVGFIVFLFVHSSSKLQSETLSLKMVKDARIANYTGMLTLYPAREIVFNMSDALISSERYVKMLENITKEYQCTNGLESCDYYSPVNGSRLCQFNISLLGDACSAKNAFGYLNRKPCILLRLEKLNDFIPESLGSPAPTWSEFYSKDHVFVSCDGKRKIDVNRMRVAAVQPAYGFPIPYYRTEAEDQHQAIGNSSCNPHMPIVAVQFPELATGCTIHIHCTVWAANTWRLKTSKVDFSIHIH